LGSIIGLREEAITIAPVLVLAIHPVKSTGNGFRNLAAQKPDRYISDFGTGARIGESLGHSVDLEQKVVKKL
jgi:hypothetical protein